MFSVWGLNQPIFLLMLSFKLLFSGEKVQGQSWEKEKDR